MKPFKEFLIEGRDAPLYHGCTRSSLISILNMDAIKPSKTPQDPETTLSKKELFGVSLTRNFDFAWKWGGEQAVIQLNQRKLAQRFRIIPLNYWHNGGYSRYTEKSGKNQDLNNEYEEFLVSDKGIENLHRYITAIHLYNLSPNGQIYKDLTAFTDKYNIPLKRVK